MPQASILIDWTMTEPSLPPKRWHEFSQRKESPELSELEKTLAWPAGTIAVLEEAFELRLSRSIGWQLGKIEEREAYFAAAKVFRRGVTQSSQEPRHLSGSYKVTFETTQRPQDLLSGDGPIIIDALLARAWGLIPRAQDLCLERDEGSKSLETAAKIKLWIENHPGTVLIVGGGILADVAAFSAALSERPFRLLPTTLLAMVDACVGGKTGVNFGRFGKNQLGPFAFPVEVIVASSWLKTLPTREFKAGLAEGYKHAVIIGDKKLSEKVSQLDNSIEAIEPLLEQLISVKAKIISQDPSEAGIRAVLNFGHTLAHAFEKISHEYSSKDPILHGEAIGIGMLFAIYLSHKLDHLSEKPFREMSDQLAKANFLIPRDQFQRQLGLQNLEDRSLIQLLTEGILQDKKNQEQGSSEWVLIRNWGEFVTRGSLYTVPVDSKDFQLFCRQFLIESGLISPQFEVKL